MHILGHLTFLRNFNVHQCSTMALTKTQVGGRKKYRVKIINAKTFVFQFLNFDLNNMQDTHHHIFKKKQHCLIVTNETEF